MSAPQEGAQRFTPLLPSAPEVFQQVGFSGTEFPETHHLMRALPLEAVAPGGVLGVWSLQCPGQFRLLATGKRRLLPSEQEMEVDTPFDIASVTKVMATASLVAQLVERRWVRWDSPVKRYLSDFPYSDITLADLLSHTAGLPAWSPLWQTLRESLRVNQGDEIFRLPISLRQAEMRRLVLNIPREAPTGERAVYSDISFLLLGYALEEICSAPLDEAVQSLVWNPMGLKGASFRRVNQSVEEARAEAFAATENCPWRGGVIQGQVHDDNCWSMGGVAGHAGVFARAEDVLRFGVEWLTRMFSTHTRSEAWSRVSRPSGCSRTLGWDTPSGEQPAAGQILSPLSVGHLGFTGTSLWIDPVRGWVITLLTNRVHLGRENIKIREFRNRLHTVLARELLALEK